MTTSIRYYHDRAYAAVYHAATMANYATDVLNGIDRCRKPLADAITSYREQCGDGASESIVALLQQDGREEEYAPSEQEGAVDAALALRATDGDAWEPDFDRTDDRDWDAYWGH